MVKLRAGSHLFSLIGEDHAVNETLLLAATETVHHGAGGLDVIYSNPLPHVLILTAIVVGVATLAIGLALVVRIREVYGTITPIR